MTTPEPHALLVAGAVSYDYLIYPTAVLTGSSKPLVDDADHNSQLTVCVGAASLVAELLTAANPQWDYEVFAPEIESVGSNTHHVPSSVIDLHNSGSSSAANRSLRVARRQIIDRPQIWHAPAIPNLGSRASTAIIYGSGDALASVQPALDFLEKVKPQFIVHYMTRPLAKGPLWDIIRNGPLNRDGIPQLDNLAVIVDADDLRAEGISLSRALSWEKTAEDFVRNLGSKGRLDTLVTCPNLIVRFGNEGVIHHRGRDATNPKLYFEPRGVEMDTCATAAGGNMIGLASAFMAGFSLGFPASSPPNVDKGIRMGMVEARKMEQTGFVSTSDDPTPKYPVGESASDLPQDNLISVATIPSAQISARDGDSWSIFGAVTGLHSEVARQIVLIGPNKPLALCSKQEFGALVSVDRTEQESLHAVVDAVQEKMRLDIRKPTSVGIVGPQGAGKKFVAWNVAKHLEKNLAAASGAKTLDFDCRLVRLEDLMVLCHTIRDHTTKGLLTIVIFENFEALMQTNNQLLNEFLVMMRDGQFTDRGRIHTIGRPLLLFLVNSENPTVDSFTTPIVKETNERRFDDAELQNYLHGVIRIAGPNQTSEDDKMFAVRRALMLRNMLVEKFPHLVVDGAIKVDDAVLHALLLVPTYKNGLRSLSQILSTSRLSARSKFEISALPPEEQIQMHVDGRIFMSFLRSPKLPASLREKIAQELFATYKKKRVQIARTEQERRELETDPSMYDWVELANELKESTRAQADDIPRKLRAVNCFMLNEDRGEPLVRVPEFSTSELDMLSEMEHERFNAERLQRQWKMGARQSDKRTTPFLVPWRDLTQDWKDVDRVMVECVPRVLAQMDWKIYRMLDDPSK